MFLYALVVFCGMRVIKERDVRNKQVLCRVDFNVPIKNGRVSDDSRIKAALPTIRFLMKHARKVILVAHLGRPKGKPVKGLRLNPVARRLEKLLNRKVAKFDDCVGVNEQVANAKAKVVLLENVRFHEGEKKNDMKFARELASYADVFVNDAFGVCHRKHASVHAVTKFLPSFAGFLVEKEVRELSSLMKKPKRPFVAMLGGAKVSDKIGLIKALLSRVDAILVGGAMAFTFLRALGLETGKSVVEEDKIKTAKALLKRGECKIWLPVDVVVARSLKAKSGKVYDAKALPRSGVGLDVGPETTAIYEAAVRGAGTVFWNGPLGFCETGAFCKGTRRVAKALAESKAVSVIGGGDTVAALKNGKGFSHVSSGGGAAIAFVEGKKLPGLEVLK